MYVAGREGEPVGKERKERQKQLSGEMGRCRTWFFDAVKECSLRRLA
jgi:hypothetical protein